MHYSGPEYLRALDRIRTLSLSTFDAFVAACNDVSLYPEIVILEDFAQRGWFIPELVKRGHQLAPRDDIRWPSMLQFACMHTLIDGARAAVALGADPEEARYGEETVVDIAIRFGRDCPVTHDLIRYLVSIYPEGMCSRSLVATFQMGRFQCVRALVDMKFPIDTWVMQAAIEHVSNINLFFNLDDEDSDLRIACMDTCRYLVAMGGRVSHGYTGSWKNNDEDSDNSDAVDHSLHGFCIYSETLARVTRCGSVSMVVLGLARARGRVHGNGRDALRLVAKQVWMSRLCDEWGKICTTEKKVKI